MNKWGIIWRKLLLQQICPKCWPLRPKKQVFSQADQLFRDITIMAVVKMLIFGVHLLHFMVLIIMYSCQFAISIDEFLIDAIFPIQLWFILKSAQLLKLFVFLQDYFWALKFMTPKMPNSSYGYLNTAQEGFLWRKTTFL